MSSSARPRPPGTSASTRPSSAAAGSTIRRVPSRINLGSRQPSTSTAHQAARSHPLSPTESNEPRAKLSGSGSGGLKKDAEGNINVVVRCRGLSSREANSTLVAEVEKTRGSTVVLHDPDPAASSSSAKAAAPLAPTRTYEFGERHVYGSDANQSMIYMDVAKPILEQVLQGYNCTIFAYGQTGTGKTYTMEGDLTSVGGTFTPDAGIIPRTLYGLFQKLAEDRVEFSVKCSFVELYNEELRDLNGMTYDDSPSAPMDPRSTKGKTTGGLKIFEDKAAGVVIQGLEETLILNAEEGLKVLKRGSDRRQIAATKCNDRSSRSHSIFSLVIHTKEVKNGEDLLKVGKLNLVDLAGSENVQRSGAENDTAREAGIINASLLALGRVINKLVEKQTHIPYRDSKLTRLLQDSLGGRTKTTIIATISPVNFDETSSTLDYAHRAKTIENRPQLNAKMTKGLLMSQFAIEIERLKLDLLAVREKNGMYFSAESWSELSAEQDQRKVQLEEQRQRAEVFESNFQGASEQLAQNLMLLGATQSEMELVRERNLRVKQEVRRLAEELLTTKGQLEGQTVLREAYEHSRAGWKDAAGVAMGDVEGLFAKLERKSSVEQANKRTISNASSSFAQHTQSLLGRLDALRSAQREFALQVEQELGSFAAREAHLLAQHVALVDERLLSLSLSSQTVDQTAGETQAQGTAFAAMVDATRAELLHAIRTQAQAAKDEQETRGQHLMQSVTEHSNSMHNTIAALTEPMRQLRAECEQKLQDQLDVLTNVQAREQEDLKAENARLRAVVAGLEAAFEAERKADQDEDEALVKLLAEKLVARSARRSAALGASQTAVAASMEEALSIRTEAVKARSVELSAVRESTAQMGALLAKRAAKVESVRREGEGLLAGGVQAFQDGLVDWAIAGEQAQSSHVELAERAEEAFAQGAAVFRADASTSRATFGEALGALAADAEETIGAGRIAVEQVGNNIRSTSELVASRIAAHSEQTEHALSETGAQIEGLASSIGPHLSSQLREDLSTGFTPIKRLPPQDVISHANLDTPSKAHMLESLLAAKREALSDPFNAPSLESLSPLLAEDGDEDSLPPIVGTMAVVGGGGRKSSLAGGGKQAPILSERDANRRRETALRGSELLGKSARAAGQGRVSKVVL